MRQTIVSLLFVAGSAFGQSVTISAPVFAGAGLNDAVSGGQFRLFPTNASYAATISATGTPDRFTWAKNGGAASAPVNIAGGTCALPALAGARGWQALADGVLICWPSNTGHTLAGTWTIKASATGRPGFISRIIDAVARTAEDKARDVLSALDAGAKADGVTVDTAKVQMVLDGGKAVLFPAGTYLIGPVAATGSHVTMDGAVFKRAPGTSGPLFSLTDSVVSGKWECDGQKGVTGTSADVCVAVHGTTKINPGLYAHDSYSHGTYVDGSGMLDSVQSDNNGPIFAPWDSAHTYATGDYVYYNGANWQSRINGNLNFVPDVSPTQWLYQPAADGISVTNANNAHIVNPSTSGNARWGVGVSTYNAGTGLTDATLSTGVVVAGQRGTGNQYGDTDFEVVTQSHGQDLIGRISASGSPNFSIEHSRLSFFYASLSDNLSAHHIEMRPSGAVGNVFYAYGASPRVSDVHIYDTAASYTSNTFEVGDPAFDASVFNVIVDKGYNTITVGGTKSSGNLRSGVALNQHIRINSDAATQYVAWVSGDSAGNTLTELSTDAGGAIKRAFPGGADYYIYNLYGGNASGLYWDAATNSICLSAGSGLRICINQAGVVRGPGIMTRQSGSGVPSSNCVAGNEIYWDSFTGDAYFCHTTNVWFLLPTGTSAAITALTGDGTATGPGSASFTLANSGVAAGTFGDSTHVAQISLDAKGRATSASSVAIAFPAAGTGFTGTKTRTTCTTISGGVPSVCSNVVETYTNGLLQ